MEYETQESKAGYTKHLNLYYDLKNTSVSQGKSTLISSKFMNSVSINKILFPEFIIVKDSQNLNLM